MKREENIACVHGVVLAFLLSFGGVGGMVTGLNLNITSMWLLGLHCALAAVLTAVLSRIKGGGWVVSAVFIGSAFFLWWYEPSELQTLEMLCKISRYYDRAYGWGTIWSEQGGQGLMHYPLGILALWIALTNSWNLCRGCGNWEGVLLAAVPLLACVVVTDTVPEPIYLYLWMLGILLVLLTQGSRCDNLRWGNSVIRIAALPAAIALGILFLAYPQEGYDKYPDELQEQIVDWLEELPDLWNEVSDELASDVDGIVQPDEVSLDDLGPRLKRVYPVMEVTAPVSGTIYLRGQDYDTYTGSGWIATEDRMELFPPEEAVREQGTITISTRRARDVIYLPYYPKEQLNLSDGRVDNVQGETVYSFEMSTLREDWHQRATADMNSVSIRQTLTTAQSGSAYLALPEDTRAGAVEILKEILTNENSATEAADTIARYVRSSALYDLNTQKMPAEYDDFVLWFLEESETGYCVHFATAATVLLRAAGIEARYVEGYMTEAVAGEEVTVTADQAHAWAEYFEPRLGTWIVLEATPADLSGGEETTAGTEEETEPPAQAEEPAFTERPEETERPEQETTASHPGGGEAPEQKADLSWLRRLPAWVLIPALAVGAAVVQRQVRLQRRSRKLRQGSSRARALARWRELEMLHRLLKSEPPEEARQIAEKAKYSRHSISADELRLLDEHIRSARERMEQRPWYLKFLDKYIFAVC